MAPLGTSLQPAGNFLGCGVEMAGAAGGSTWWGEDGVVVGGGTMKPAKVFPGFLLLF